MASNTIETCPAGDPACTPAQDGKSSASNNSFVMRLVDVDADPATFDSSRAQVHLPADATVLFAALYWGANTAAGTKGAAARDASARGTVMLETPAGGGYKRVTAGTVDRGSATSQKDAYQGFADVTALVRAAGAGVYTVANVQAGTGEDRYGGWTLVVAYRDRLAPARNLTIFDGLVTINSGDPPRRGRRRRLPHAELRPRALEPRADHVRGRPVAGRRQRRAEPRPPRRCGQPFQQPLQLDRDRRMERRRRVARPTTTTNWGSTRTSSMPRASCATASPARP